MSAQSLLGEVLNRLDDVYQARECYEEALEIYQQLEGKEHPETMRVLIQLGSLLYSLTDVRGAQRCYEEALAICRETLGEMHLHTAYALAHLGRLYASRGRNLQALRFYRQSYAIRQALAPNDPQTSRIGEAIAGVHRSFIGDIIVLLILALFIIGGPLGIYFLTRP